MSRTAVGGWSKSREKGVNLHEENEGNEEIVVENQNYSNGKELNVD